jgi:SSS family solute:Na+ symporter
MTSLDWAIVLVLNGAIVAYGMVSSRGTRTGADWFLAGRTLPWWMVGCSLWATAIDTSDLVADNGGTYALGMSYLVTGWVGTVGGWILGAHLVFPVMYRAGMYTNAEYLEARFGAAMRVLSALVQVQYRTLVLGIIATTNYLVLAVVCGWEREGWPVVVGTAVVAAIYTAFGGLRAVAVTDALQTVIMVAASIVLFALAWIRVGGWGGLEASLAGSEPGLARQLLHVGAGAEGQPAWLVCFAFFVVGLAYSIVNHTQSMRLFGARSEWDMKMAVVVAGVVMLVTNFTNLTLGIFGRALYPEAAQMPLEETLRHRDSIFPLLLRELAGPGFKGLVVAGIVAAFLSTYDSIGSTLSALLTRDVYARFVRPDRGDRHYLLVARWLTPVILLGSFAYVPFLLGGRGLLLKYVDLVGVFVVPLLTVYLMGVFTRVHRRSGIVGLVAGVCYGFVRLALPSALPAALTGYYASYPAAILITAGAMVVTSMLLGWQPRGELSHEERAGWLRESRLIIRELDRARGERSPPALPLVLGALVAACGLVLSFVVFW